MKIKEKYHDEILLLLKDIFTKMPSCPICKITNPNTYNMCSWSPCPECEDWAMFENELTEESGVNK